MNKVNTKVEIRLCLGDLMGLSPMELMQVRSRLANRINALDELVLASSEERSQSANRERGFSRLEALILAAAKLPKNRKSTAPTRASRERRLAKKKLHSAHKGFRRHPIQEE